MSTYDAQNARCRVFTFKEGLLSAVAHDLEIDVGVFRLTHEGSSVTATFDPNSLRVLHAMGDGRPRSDALSPKDREKIEANIRGEVLETKRHPEIRFSGSVEGAEVVGTLELHGRKRELRVTMREEATQWVGEVTLHQPDFGITPYSAMLGTLRIKPDVRVRIEIPRA